MMIGGTGLNSSDPPRSSAGRRRRDPVRPQGPAPIDSATIRMPPPITRIDAPGRYERARRLSTDATAMSSLVRGRRNGRAASGEVPPNRRCTVVRPGQ